MYRCIKCACVHCFKESGCWGYHLNRKNLPAALPKLSSDDKETLKASAQYFGMKLKNNLGALTKVNVTYTVS